METEPEKLGAAGAHGGMLAPCRLPSLPRPRGTRQGCGRTVGVKESRPYALLHTHSPRSHHTDRRPVAMMSHADFQGNGNKTEGMRVTHL